MVTTAPEATLPPGDALLRTSPVRKTAADRPGVAQPVPERDIPPHSWGPILLAVLLASAFMLGGWEWHWRAYGVTPSYRNSEGQWAQQRRRIDSGEGNQTVMIGASRVFFDVQLPAWERATGERPIQLAIEGTSPTPMLQDLADDPDFTGRLLVGVAPDIFFSGSSYRGAVLSHYRKESPSDRAGTWLSMQLVEPYFAFYDPDYALHIVVERQPWPARAGMPNFMEVRKLSVSDADRNTHLWDKVATDLEYRAMARHIWSQHFGEAVPGMETPEKARKVFDEQIAVAVVAVQKLQARGVPVIFVRLPSDGDYYAYEQKYFPRAGTWEPLLKRTGASGIHFEDYPQLQGYYLPEWSHLAPGDAVRLTEQLVPIVEREFDKLRAANGT